MSVADSPSRSSDGRESPLPKLVLGSRGSDLALAQARLVEHALRVAHPALNLEIRLVRTRGDESSDRARKAELDPRAGRKGLFTGEIERELLAGAIDLAIHSAKDLPSDLTAGTRLAAALPRARSEDVLVTKCGGGFEALPEGASIGTASVRRQHQIRAHYSHVQVVDLRGNVPTRLRKLVEKRDLHGAILARAGLDRLGFDLQSGRINFEGAELRTTVLRADQFLPAGGQGIVALQIRANDPEAAQGAAAVNHRETFVCLRAEREFLRLLQGDCDSPVGVLATCEGEALSLRGEVFEQHSEARKIGRVEGSIEQPEQLARDLMKQMYGR